MLKRMKPPSGLNDWLDLIDNPNPMDALDEVRDAILQATAQNDETRFQSIGFIAECLRKSDDDAEYLRSLKSSSVFLDDNSGPRKLSVLIARHILDVKETSGARYEKARSYGQVADYFAETRRSAFQIAEYLGRNGIRNTLEHFRKVEKEPVERGEDIGELRDVGCEDRPELVAGFAKPEKGKSQGTPSPRPASRQEAVERALARDPLPPPSRPKLNLETMLVLEASESLLAQMFKLKVGESATSTIYRDRNHEGQDWYRFVIANIVASDD